MIYTRKNATLLKFEKLVFFILRNILNPHFFENIVRIGFPKKLSGLRKNRHLCSVITTINMYNL